MRKIKIITDSTSDLPNDLLTKNEIEIAPLTIILGEQTFLDDGSVTSKDLFRFAEENKALPKTAAVNVFQFEKIFSKWLKLDYDILFIGISKKLSSTVQNAIIASRQLGEDKISVIDSMSLSSGIGLQVLQACDARDEGASLKEITDNATMLRSKARVSFVLDTLKYLYMGGRCSRLSSLMGTKLKIKPMLELINGEVVPTTKFRGSNYIDKYFNLIMENADKIDSKRVFVTSCLSDEAENFKKRLESEFNLKNVYTPDASATISTHCGPGTIGILYIEK